MDFSTKDLEKLLSSINKNENNELLSMELSKFRLENTERKRDRDPLIDTIQPKKKSKINSILIKRSDCLFDAYPKAIDNFDANFQSIYILIENQVSEYFKEVEKAEETDQNNLPDFE